MLVLLRQSTKHVVAALVAGLLLRLWFIHYYPVVDGDSLVYGEIARNWFWHGIYGFTRVNGIHPTLIRLPGYPLFLGICFFIFGIDHYQPVLLLQAAIDLCSCLLIAGFAARTISRRAGVATLYLAALCPFTANFVASPLTETPTLFCIALGLYALPRYVEKPKVDVWFWALVFSISYAALLRPDGALLGLVLVPAMVFYARSHIPTTHLQNKSVIPTGAQRSGGTCGLPDNAKTRVPHVSLLRHGFRRHSNSELALAIACTLLALVPFAAWTIRNARTLHVFQPLAPRYANNPGEYVPRGWIRWVQSWAADYTSTAEIYWNVNGSPLDVTLLPSRAFDTPQQETATTALFDQYNRTEVMTPALSERFGQLAEQRIRHAPLRFYVTLPLMRLADMWLRPRTGQLWIELRWWQYWHHPAETIFSWSYGALNLVYILLAAWGLKKRVPFTGVMIAYILIRCLLLLTVETPESRYTLECFPMIFILAGAALASRKKPVPHSSRPLA